MKKGIIIISLILLGITAFRFWRIQETRSLKGVGKATVEAFSPISPVNKWAGSPPVPALNAVFGIISEKEKEEKTKSAMEMSGEKAGKKEKTASQNAGKPKSLPRVFGIFSEEGNSFALIERKPEKVETKAQGGPQSKSQPGYLVVPEGAEVESFLLSEILPTRLLFKIEGEEDRLVELFQYDEKAIKGGGTGNDNEGDSGKSKSTGNKVNKAGKSNKSPEK